MGSALWQQPNLCPTLRTQPALPLILQNNNTYRSKMPAIPNNDTCCSLGMSKACLCHCKQYVPQPATRHACGVRASHTHKHPKGCVRPARKQKDVPTQRSVVEVQCSSCLSTLPSPPCWSAGVHTQAAGSSRPKIKVQTTPTHDQESLQM
jgi:hypothetical protein